jgi:hypothetical protein
MMSGHYLAMVSYWFVVACQSLLSRDTNLTVYSTFSDHSTLNYNQPEALNIVHKTSEEFLARCTC